MKISITIEKIKMPNPMPFVLAYDIEQFVKVFQSDNTNTKLILCFESVSIASQFSNTLSKLKIPNSLKIGDLPFTPKTKVR